jgi:hypothetical protein
MIYFVPVFLLMDLLHLIAVLICMEGNSEMASLKNKDWRNEINGVGAQMWFMCKENMFTDLHINVINKQHTRVN